MLLLSARLYLWVHGQSSVGVSQLPAQVHFTGTYDIPTVMPPGLTLSYGFVSGYAPNPLSATSQVVGSTTNFAGPSITATTNPINAPQWYFDSGATHYVTNNLQNLQIAQPATQNEGVVVGNGSHIPVTHTGTGQARSSNSVSGTMSQGSLSYPDLI